MPFPSVSPGQVSALTASYLQAPTLLPGDPQAMFTFGGQYLQNLIGGNGNLIWSNGGVCYDSDRQKVLSCAQGGHADSGDNSVYEFDIQTTQTWSNVLPATYLAPGNLIPGIAPGIASKYTDTINSFGAGAGALWPSSMHRYQGQIYMPSVKKVWCPGGVYWEQIGSTTGEIFWYDPVAKVWTFQNEGILNGGAGISAAWDPQTYRVYYHSQNVLSYYDPALAAGSRQAAVTGDEGGWTSAAMTGCFDWRRRRYVMAGWNSTFGGGNLYWYDLLRNPNSATRVIQALPAPFIGCSVAAEAPGFFYDIIRDRYIIWLGYSGDDGVGHLLNAGAAANSVWEVHPDTFAVTKITFTGDTVPISIGATWGRFLHATADDVYLLFNYQTQNAYAFRHPDQTNVFAMPNRDL